VSENHEPAFTTLSRMAVRTTLFSIIDKIESVPGVQMAKV